MNNLLTRALNSDGLKGRKAIVFGASSCIVFSCTETLSALGADVVMIARDEEKLKRSAEALRNNGNRRITTEVQDITVVPEMQKILEKHTDTDILITNCGGPPVAPFKSFSLQHWEDAWASQLRSVIQATTTLVPAMAERGWGRVIMLASVTIVHPMQGFALSNSIRPGLSGLTATLTQEFSSKGVTANTICPGITSTERMEKLIAQAVDKNKTRADVIQEWTQNIPVNRLASADEIAALVGFVASDAAGFITGQTLVADGGQSVAG